MITRVLDPAEYAEKLAGTELEAVWPHFASLPGGADVIVVEDDGRVVGCWALFALLHCEGVWIAEDKRGGSSVQRRLLAKMRELALEKGAKTVITYAVSDIVNDICKKLGFPLPGVSYSLKIGHRSK